MSRFLKGLPLRAKRILIVLDKHLEEDGGPGSGNWGHKGRPGQVGGSGKGGGRQYRGGRGDIMYTSSKHDWLNGLQGEKQKETQQWLKSRAESMKNGEEDKRSAEQMVMQGGSLEEKKHMLGLMQEARHWDKLAGRMISENLDDKDKALVTALAAKYNLEYKGGAMIPDETDMSDEDRACWYDLKSKAMYGETSGQEAPDELQYAAGLKERPKPKGTMWSPGNIQRADYATAEMGAQRALGRYVNLGSINSKEELDGIEKEMFENLYASSNTYWVDRGLKMYLREKCREAGGFTLGNVPQECLDRLDPEEKAKLDKMLLAAFRNREGLFNSLDLESQQTRAESFAILNKALGGADLVTFVEQKNQERIAKEEEERKRLDEERLKREEEWRRRQEEQRKMREEAERKKKEFAAAQRKTFTEGKVKRREALRDATTVGEIESAMNGGGIFREGSSAKISSVSVECARATAFAYERVCDRFPFLIGCLSSLRDSERRSRTYACCHTMEGGGVDLNPMYFGDAKKLSEQYVQDVRSRWHPADTDWTSIVTHELGHAVDGYMSTRKIIGSEPYGTTAQRFSGILFKRTMKVLKKKWSDVERELSRYGAKKNNHAEWFAECFAEAMDSPNPRPMAAEMMRQLEIVIQQEGLNNV